MDRKKIYYSKIPAIRYYSPYYKKYFFKIFGKGGEAPDVIRPGAMLPEEVKREIQRIGIGKILELTRIGYDGKIDDIPMIVEIINVTREGFSGKVVNVERKVIEENTKSTVYARREGRIIDFFYSDGDIKTIKEGQDAEELSEGRDVSGIFGVLSALDIGARILVSYYDEKHRGTVNVEGALLFKFFGNKKFKMDIDKINGIALENKVERLFDIEKDLVIEISLL